MKLDKDFSIESLIYACRQLNYFFSQKEGLDEVIHDKRSVIDLIDLNAKQIENKI
jgi:hypothetical protein